MSPADTARIYDHAQSVYWLGYVDWQHARLDEAAGHFAEYMKLASRLTELDPGNQSFQSELASANVNMGVLQIEQGQLEAAVKSLSASRDIREAIKQSHPDDSGNLNDLANAYGWMGVAQEDLANLDGAFESRVSQTELLDALHQNEPGNTDFSAQLVTGWRHLGRLSLAVGDMKMSEQQLIRSIELAKLLLQLDSKNTYWSEIAGLSFLDYAELLLWAKRPSEAERMINDAEGIADWLTEQDKNVLDWQVTLAARAEELRARLMASEGHPTEAIASLDRLSARLAALAGKHPDDRNVNSVLATVQLYCGEILADTDRRDDAQPKWQMAADTLSARAAPLPLADRAILALAYHRLGQTDRASELVAGLKKAGFKHPIMEKLSSTAGATVGEETVPPTQGSDT